MGRCTHSANQLPLHSFERRPAATAHVDVVELQRTEAVGVRIVRMLREIVQMGDLLGGMLDTDGGRLLLVVLMVVLMLLVGVVFQDVAVGVRFHCLRVDLLRMDFGRGIYHCSVLGPV